MLSSQSAQTFGLAAALDAIRTKQEYKSTAARDYDGRRSQW